MQILFHSTVDDSPHIPIYCILHSMAKSLWINEAFVHPIQGLKYSIQWHPMQLCVSNYVSTSRGRPADLFIYCIVYEFIICAILQSERRESFSYVNN